MPSPKSIDDGKSGSTHNTTSTSSNEHNSSSSPNNKKSSSSVSAGSPKLAGGSFQHTNTTTATSSNNNEQNTSTTSSSMRNRSSVSQQQQINNNNQTRTASSGSDDSSASSSSVAGSNDVKQHHRSSNNSVNFSAPLGRNPEKARQAILQASDDALGVHRRSFIRRSTMFVKIIIFLAFVATLAFLAQQVTSISDLISSQLSDVSLVRAIADGGKPIAAGAVVSFTSGGVQQGHGPSVGIALTALPCDPEFISSSSSQQQHQSRVFFTNGNSTSNALVSVAATKSLLSFWMVDSMLSVENNVERNVSSLTSAAGENGAANGHIALAGCGSSTINGGNYANSPFMVLAGASSGSSSVYLHIINSPSSATPTATTTLLASYFTLASGVDRSSAFIVSVPPPLKRSYATPATPEIAVVGYICALNTCCVDLVSWTTGAVLHQGPRLTSSNTNTLNCPTHGVHFVSKNSSSPISYVVLPMIPVVVLQVNVTKSGNYTVSVSQTLRLTIGGTFNNNSGVTGKNVRIASIPLPHTKQSLLLSVALHDVIQVFQIHLFNSSSSTFFIPSLYATIRTGLSSGPLSLSGFVFSSSNSWASVYFSDMNQLQYLIQVSFLNSNEIGSKEVSAPRLVPTIGGSDVEYLWQSDVWRHTMVVLRESPSLCGLRSIEWHGGLNFAGVASTTVQAGQSVDVYTGGIVRIFANLIPGTKYSVGVNGTLVPIFDPLSLGARVNDDVVGRALSSTEMYLYPTR